VVSLLRSIRLGELSEQPMPPSVAHQVCLSARVCVCVCV
jgi:hypothetical protein